MKLGSLHCCAFMLLRPRIEQTSLPRGGNAAGGAGSLPGAEDGGSRSPCRQLPPSEVELTQAAPPFLLHGGHSYSTPGRRASEGSRGQAAQLMQLRHMEKHEEKERQPPFGAPSCGPHHLLSAPQAPSNHPQAHFEHSIPLLECSCLPCGSIQLLLTLQLSALSWSLSCPQVRLS